MSVPNATGKVKRPYYIEIMAQDINGNPIKKQAEGFEAIVLCHEIDHLDGIEYTDKAEDMHYNISVEERLQIRKDHPHEIISKKGNFNQTYLPINIRTKIYK
jgi:peptide deformylase